MFRGVDDSVEHDATSSASVLCNVAAQNDAMVYTFEYAFLKILFR